MFAATIGFFDGVHAGHRFLIHQLIPLAQSRGLQSMIVTFEQHPRTVIQPSYQLPLLNEPDEKWFLLQQTGIDKIHTLPFTKEMSQLTAREFIQEVLFKQLNVRFLLTGYDHRFGRNRTDSFPDYVRYGNEIGMEIEQLGRYATNITPHVSSTEIRYALHHGNIPFATQMLGYPYHFTGKVVSGYQVGRKIGFPTANLVPVYPQKLIPGVGVYAVKVEFQSKQHIGMMNIGHRPTFDQGNTVSIEVHIFDFEGEIYNENVTVTMLRKIREEQKFAHIDALIHQLHLDRNIIKAEYS